jgi:methylmalonyl-CoA mutase N-terminal domain/subunit
LTAQEPENNIIRVALQALSSVLGGTQSLHTNSYDEALNLPSEKAVKIALRTQQIIAHETQLPLTIDPFGGSYCIEKLTDAVEEETFSIIRTIDERGGAAQCIQNGYSHGLIEESAYRYQTEVENKAKKVLGLNYPKRESVEPPLFRFSRELEEERKMALDTYRNKRDTGKAIAALEKLQGKAKGDENLMPSFLNAVRQDCTLGEITNTLKKEFGTYD